MAAGVGIAVGRGVAVGTGSSVLVGTGAGVFVGTAVGAGCGAAGAGPVCVLALSSTALATEAGSGLESAWLRTVKTATPAVAKLTKATPAAILVERGESSIFLMKSDRAMEGVPLPEGSVASLGQCIGRRRGRSRGSPFDKLRVNGGCHPHPSPRIKYGAGSLPRTGEGVRGLTAEDAEGRGWIPAFAGMTVVDDGVGAIHESSAPTNSLLRRLGASVAITVSVSGRASELQCGRCG